MLKSTIIHSDAWTYASGKREVTFDLPENGDREDFVVVEVRSVERVDCYGISKVGADNKRALPLASGTFFAVKLRLQGFTSITLQSSKSAPWAYSVTSREGRRTEKLDPRKLRLVPPKHDVSDLASLVEAAIARRMGDEKPGFEDPENALSFDDLDEAEFGEGYMEPDTEMGDVGYMETRPRRLDKPPVKSATKKAGSKAGDASGDSDSGGDSDGVSGKSGPEGAGK
jgi:hypothetical protein